MSSKVSNLTSIGTLDSTDYVYVVDDTAGTPASRKATVGTLEATIQSDLRLWNNVRAASDQDVASNTVVASDNELFFTMAAATMYQFEGAIMYSSPAGAGTPDIKYTFNGPATLTGFWSVQSTYYTTADAAGSAQAGIAYATAGTSGTSATPRLLLVWGWAYSTGGGSGSSGLVFQWAQNTSGVNATRRLAGSIIRWRVIS